MLRFVLSVLTKLVVKSVLSAYFRCLLWLILLLPCVLVDILALVGMRLGLSARRAYYMSITLSTIVGCILMKFFLGWSTTFFSVQHCTVDNTHPFCLLYMCVIHLCSCLYYASQVIPATIYAAADFSPAFFSHITVQILLLAIYLVL